MVPVSGSAARVDSLIHADRAAHSGESAPADPSGRRYIIDADKTKEQARKPAKGSKSRKSRPIRDFSWHYMQKQVDTRTPMVFVTRDGEIRATVVEHGMFQHLLCVDGEPTPVAKLSLQYHYKQIDADTVTEKIAVDETVRARNEPTPSGYKERHLLSNRDLWKAKRRRVATRFTMRNGAVFRGMVDWFGPYEVKLGIGPRGEDDTASVVLHRHAALSVELLEEPKPDPPSRDEDA